MTLEFQKELFRFLIQSKEGRRLVGILDKSIFDVATDKVIYGLVTGFKEKYGVIPATDIILKEWFDTELSRTKQAEAMSPEVYKKMYRDIEYLYKDAGDFDEFMLDKAIDLSQRKLTKELIRQNSAKVDDGDEDVYSTILYKMKEIVELKEGILNSGQLSGGFIADNEVFQRVESHPTYLKGLNRLTTAKGFHTPQLIILMGGPKSFKTGHLIEIGVEYMRRGLKVYYADFENGYMSILQRGKQAIMKATESEIFDDSETVSLTPWVVNAWKMLGGDFRSDFYVRQVDSVLSVEAKLMELAKEQNWRPDVIIWDYPDLVAPANKRVTDKRLITQEVYFDIIALNNRLEIFSIGASQVNRAAVEKDVITMTDFAEDFGKAANCHAAFAICRTENEKLAGVGRIVPVAQRQGKAFKGDSTTVFTRIDEERMSVEEIDRDEYMKLLQSVVDMEPQEERTRGHKSRRPRPKNRIIEDE